MITLRVRQNREIQVTLELKKLDVITQFSSVNKDGNVVNYMDGLLENIIKINLNDYMVLNLNMFTKITGKNTSTISIRDTQVDQLLDDLYNITISHMSDTLINLFTSYYSIDSFETIIKNKIKLIFLNEYRQYIASK